MTVGDFVATARHKQKLPCELHVRGKNRVLWAAEVAGQPVQGLERVTLKKKATLYKPDAPVTHAFFPLTGVASVVATVPDGGALEVGTTGNEGIVGLPLLLGSDRSHTEAFVQIGGDFMRMTRQALKRELEANSPFAEIARRYVQGFFMQAAQSAACLRFHQIEHTYRTDASSGRIHNLAHARRSYEQ
jgi:hypothetical protein